MTNTIYQETVKTLEAVLSPRVVSRSLHEDLKGRGKSPDTVTLGDIEEILKGQIYRQLQVTMPVTQAKDTISELLERLKESQPSPEAARSADQKRALEEFQEALRPFNLYFEWPETQKLRAQLGLVTGELEAGNDASRPLADARTQLSRLEQKLEDQLVTQARTLAELTSAAEVVKTLGGPKIRRLESLLGQIRGAQEARQLAAAEIERARKLATDLRKLMTSSVVVEADNVADAAPKPVHASYEPEMGLLDVEGEGDALLSIDAGLSEGMSAQLLHLDLESEARELEALRSDFASLLVYKPELISSFERLERSLTQTTPSGERLPHLRKRLTEAQEALRAELRNELGALKADAEGNSRLGQALLVTLGVLETTLPDPADVERVRSLHKLGAPSQGAAGDANTRRGELLETLHRLEEEREPYRGIAFVAEPLAKLETLLSRGREALEAGHLVKGLERGWELLEGVRERLMTRAETFESRLDAALATFEPIAKLNSEDSTAVGLTLAHLDSQRSAYHRVSPRVQDELEHSLAEAQGVTEVLQEQFDATREIAGQLMSGSFLDDVLGALDNGIFAETDS